MKAKKISKKEVELDEIHDVGTPEGVRDLERFLEAREKEEKRRLNEELEKIEEKI